MRPLVSSLSDQDTVFGNFGGSEGEAPVSRLLGHTGIVTVDGAAYDMRLSDVGKWIEVTNGSAVTITILRESTIPWPARAFIGWEQNGAGQLTFAAGSSVTINTSETLKSAKQYATGTLFYKGNDVWIIGGYLEAA